jgi:ElaB/YqjD/DUF883 family membrane-anchored ribosome-binding protein
MHPDGDGSEKYVLCRSQARGEKEKAMLERQMKRLTEELLKMTADHVGDNAQEVRDRVSKRLHQAVSELQHLQTVTVAQVKAAGHATDEFVHENPWKSIGIASGLGLIVGLLIARR